jgi:hypothetical protein
MNAFWKSGRQWIAVALLGLGLSIAPAFGPAAQAQDPNDPSAAPVPGEGSGRSLDGYLGTIVLMLLVFFIVGKSARR